MQRSLANNSNTFVGYPIVDNPTNNTALFYANGEFFFASISESGGIIGVVSVGSGASIINALSGGVLDLRSFIASNGNIIVQQLADNISIGLNNFINNISEILFQDESFIKVDGNNLDITVSDGGAAVLKYLNFNTKFGALSTTAMSISNQARIDIYGETYFNTVATGLPNASEFLSIDVNGKLIKAVVSAEGTTAINVGSGTYQWYLQEVGNELQFRTFNVADNLLCDNNLLDLTLKVSPILNNMQQINSSSNLNFTSPNYTFNGNNLVNNVSLNELFGNVKLNNLTANKYLKLDSSSVIIPGAEPLQTIQNNGFNSLISQDNISTTGNLQLKGLEEGQGIFISSTANNVQISNNAVINSVGSGSSLVFNTFPPNYQIKSIAAGANISFLETTTTITIAATTPSTTNIYNSDGQITDTVRIINGNPLTTNSNRLIFSGTNINFTNNLAYEPTDTTTYGDLDCILGFPIGSLYSRAIWAPYNYLSQKISVPVSSAYGSFNEFYRSSVTTNNSRDWNFEVEVYEVPVAGIDHLFSASYKFNVNNLNIGSPQYYVKPIQTSSLGNAVSMNLLGLEAFQFIGGWGLRLVQLGLGAGTYNSTYTVFVKDLSKGDKTIDLNQVTGIKTPTNNYLDNFELFRIVGTGAPPSGLFRYEEFGRDIEIYVNSQIFGSSPNASGSFNVFFNGSIVASCGLRTYGTNNVPIPCTLYRRLKMVDLIGSGALILNGNTTISFTITAFSFTNAPYAITINYC